jgi:hypothetical protein
LEVARRLGIEGSAAAAAAAAARVHLTAAEALATAAREGLTLVPADNETGFKNVKKHGKLFRAQIMEGGVLSCLGGFATPQQAALVVARHRKEGSAAAVAAPAPAPAAAAAVSGSSRKRPLESKATTSRSGRRCQPSHTE